MQGEKPRSRARVILAAAAFILITFGYPLLVDQGWLRYEPHVLPALILAAGLLLLAALFYSKPALKMFGRLVQEKGMAIMLPFFILVGAGVGSAIGAGYYGLLRISKTHVTELLNKERKPESTSTPELKANRLVRPSSALRISRIPDGMTLTPPAGKIALTFKSSPLFNHSVRQHVTHDFTRFRDYLVTLEIPVPTDVPPIGTLETEGADDVTETQSSTAEGRPTYESALVLNKKILTNSNELTKVYCEYSMKLIFASGTPLKEVQSVHSATSSSQSQVLRLMHPTGRGEQTPISPLLTVTQAEEIFLVRELLSDYLNTSFWNKKPARAPALLGALWDIRDKFGHEFTDGMVAYTLRASIDEPYRAEGDYQIYFLEKLKIGEDVKDNESNKWLDIQKILEMNGFPVKFE